MHVTEIIHWIVEGIRVMGTVGGLLYVYKWFLQILGYTDLEAKKYLQTAKKCFDNGVFEDAVESCDEVIIKENGFLYRHRRFVPTEDRISFDTVAEAYVLKGDSFIKLSRYADAIQTYDKAIEKSCVSPEIVRKAYFGKGEALMRLENWKEAREVYQKIIRQYAEDWEEAKYYFAYCCMQIEQWDEAKNIFKELKQSENKVIGVLACFHLAEKAKSSKDLYNECYEKISDVSSNDNRLVEVWVRLGDFFYNQGDDQLTKANDCYEKVIKVENSRDIDMKKYYIEACCGQGDVLRRLPRCNKFQEASELYDRAIRCNEEYVRAYYGKATALFKFDCNKACEVCTEIIQKFEDIQNDNDKEYVAKALIDLGDFYRKDKTKSESYFLEVIKKFEKEKTKNLLAQVKIAYEKIIEGRCSKLSLKEDYKNAFTVYTKIFEEFREKPLCEGILNTTCFKIIKEVDDVSKELFQDANKFLGQGSWEESLTDFKRCICLIRRSISFGKKFNMGGDSGHEWRQKRVVLAYLGRGLVLNARDSYEKAARICKVIWKIVSKENLPDYDYHLLYLQKSVLTKLKRWDDLIQMYDDMLGRYEGRQDGFVFWCLCLCYKVNTFVELERDYIKEIDKMFDSFSNEGKFLLNKMICLYYKAGAFTKLGKWDVAYKFYEQILSGDEKFDYFIKKWAEEEKRIIDSSKENDQVIVEKVIEERVKVAEDYLKHKNFTDFIRRFGILSIKEPRLCKLVVKLLYEEVDPCENVDSNCTLFYFVRLENFTDEFEKIKDSFGQINDTSKDLFFKHQLQKLGIDRYLKKRPETYHALNTLYIMKYKQ